MLEETKKKVVINTCYGGFGLSPFAELKYAEAKGIQLYAFREDYSVRSYKDISRYVPISLEEAIKCEDTLHFRTSPTWETDDNSYFSTRDIRRDDPILVSLLEEYGSDKISGHFSSLTIVEIPDNISWDIEEYDGNEWVSESHRTWS